MNISLVDVRNDEEMMDWLLERNLDYITTNEPELLLKKVNPQ